jgi:hypothetical protein
LSGLEPRLKEVVECLQKIIKENPGAIRTDIEGADPDLVWIDRHLVQKEIGLKSRDPMIERVKLLSDMGILAYFNRGSRAYIAFKYSDSASNLPSNYPLITVDQKELYDYIKRNEDVILKELLDGKSTVKLTFASPDKKINSNLLSLENSYRRQSQKNVHDDHELNIIKTLKQKFDGIKSTVNNKQGDPQQILDSISKNQPNLQVKIKELKNFITDQQQKGNKITYDNLIFNFDQVFIEKCKQNKILIPLPDGNYGFGGVP